MTNVIVDFGYAAMIQSDAPVVFGLDIADIRLDGYFIAVAKLFIHGRLLGRHTVMHEQTLASTASVGVTVERLVRCSSVFDIINTPLGKRKELTQLFCQLSK